MAGLDGKTHTEIEFPQRFNDPAALARSEPLAPVTGQLIFAQRSSLQGKLFDAPIPEPISGTVISGGSSGASSPGDSNDHFLIERYNLYVARRGGLFRGRVRHEPYPLRRATVVHMSQTMLNAASLPAPTDAPFSHYSRG